MFQRDWYFSPRLERTFSYVDRVLISLAGMILLIAMLHVCLGALFRAVHVSINLQTLTIVSAWYMIGITFLSMPYMNRIEGCMSIDIFSGFIKGKWKVIKNGFTSLLVVGYLGLMGCLTFGDALKMTLSREIRETATGYLTVWPPRWVLPLVFLVMALYAALRGIEAAIDRGRARAGTGG